MIFNILEFFLGEILYVFTWPGLKQMGYVLLILFLNYKFWFDSIFSLMVWENEELQE